MDAHTEIWLAHRKLLHACLEKLSHAFFVLQPADVAHSNEALT